MKTDRFAPIFICFVAISLLFSTLVYAQNVTVTATCVDESGNPDPDPVQIFLGLPAGQVFDAQHQIP